MWVLILGCNGAPEAPPVEGGRVLDGPLLGRGLDAAPGQLWVGAPGVDGAGVVARFDGLDGSTLGDAAVTIAADGPSQLGGAVARCPDLDGDGRADLVLGAPGYGDRGGSWWVHDPAGDLVVSGAVFVEGLHRDGHAGTAVACGDLDDDGRSDVATSAPDTDGLGPAVLGGTIEVYREQGGAPEKFAHLETTWDRSQLGFRSSLVMDRDLDGDGIDDLLVGGHGADQVHVMHGPLTGTWDTNAAQTFTGFQDQATGYAVAAGDLDGDGSTDLLAGAPLAYAEQGSVWLVPGPLGRDDHKLDGLGHPIHGAGLSDQAGFSLAVVGDVDGDGAEDWLVGAPTSGGEGPEAGAAYLVLGPGLDLEDLDYADAVFVGDVAYGRLGWAVAGADLDQDGSIELVISAPERDVGDTIGAGSVFVFPGTVRERVQVSDAITTITP